MRNNGLVFLGFVIICLVNLETGIHREPVPTVSAPAPRKAVPDAELKMATLPEAESAQLAVPDRS